MSKFLLDHKENSNGQLLTSLFSLARVNRVDYTPSCMSQCIHYFSSAVFAPSQSLDGSTHAHTVREKGIRTLGKIGSRPQLPPEHWSWPTAQPPWAVRNGYWELFWQWPPFPRYSVRRISPLAVTSLSRVVVGSRNRAVLWLWEAVLGSFLLSRLSWRLCWPSTCQQNALASLTVTNPSMMVRVTGR